MLLTNFRFISSSEKCRPQPKWSKTSSPKLSREKASLPSSESPDSSGPSRTSKDFWAPTKWSNLPGSASTSSILRQVQRKFNLSTLTWCCRTKTRVRNVRSSWSKKRMRRFWRRPLWKVLDPRMQVVTTALLTFRCRWKRLTSLKCRRTTGRKSWPSLCPTPSGASRMNWPSKFRSLLASLLRKSSIKKKKWNSSFQNAHSFTTIRIFSAYVVFVAQVPLYYI